MQSILEIRYKWLIILQILFIIFELQKSRSLMLKMAKYVFVCFSSLLFLATSCPKDDKKTAPVDQLPPITQSGNNTYGFLKNGKVWLPIGSALPKMNPQYYHGLFSCIAHKIIYDKDKNPTVRQDFGWAIYPVRDTGIYYVKNDYTPFDRGHYLGASYTDELIPHDYDVNDKDSLKNWIHLTRIDSVNRIISGTFNFFFADPGFDTVNISKGRFDVVYTY
jgi:hypothetical protein